MANRSPQGDNSDQPTVELTTTDEWPSVLAAPAPNGAATEVDPTPATPLPEGDATPDAMGMDTEPALTGGSGGTAGSGRPKPRRAPRPSWSRRRRDLPADPVTGQIDTEALWNARMRVEFTVDLDDELAAFEREMERVKAVAMDAGVTYADLHRRITFAQEASKLGFTGLAQVQAYVFVGDRLDVGVGS